MPSWIGWIAKPQARLVLKSAWLESNSLMTMVRAMVRAMAREIVRWPISASGLRW